MIRNESSLFDDDIPSPGGLPDTDNDPTTSSWREQPTEHLTRAELLDYCARRDEDSALFAVTLDDARWYLWRAARYRQMMTEME
jgi:hypothetical protein